MKKLNINFCGWGQNWHLGTLAHEGRTLTVGPPGVYQ